MFTHSYQKAIGITQINTDTLLYINLYTDKQQRKLNLLIKAHIKYTQNISSYLISFNWPISLMSRVFTNGPGDWGSIPDQVIPKTQKIVLDATLLSTQHYKVITKGKVEQSGEWSSTLPYTLV